MGYLMGSRDWMRAGFWFTMGSAWAALLCFAMFHLVTWMWESFAQEWQRW